MHAFIFRQLKVFFKKRYGHGFWEKLDLPEEIRSLDHTVTGAFPADTLFDLLSNAVSLSGESEKTILNTFGHSLGEIIMELAGFMGVLQPGHTMLATLEQLHESLDKLPQLNINRSITSKIDSNDPNRIILTCPIDLRWEPLLRGLIIGAGKTIADEVIVHSDTVQTTDDTIPTFRLIVDSPKSPIKPGSMDVTVDLQRILDDGGAIKLHNYYKNIPISYPGELIGVDRTVLRIRAPKKQLIAMRHEGYVTFASTILDHPLIAQIKRIDLHQRQAVLFQVEPLPTEQERRKTIRVTPSKPIPCTIKGQDAQSNSTISDLSSDGMSATVITSSRSIQQKNMLRIRFTLPLELWDPLTMEPHQDKVPIEAWGQVVGLMKQQDNRALRIHFSRIERSQQAAIEQYVMERQIETLEELDRFRI
ncbi:MAG: PilZ domain-containing protein [Magnetococcales bacterium]|nr:PilZ domain-containing protein [Magnetococcales bacterium]